MGNNPHSIVSRMKTAQAVTGINADGVLDIEELDAGTVNVASDTFIFNDADDGATKEDRGRARGGRGGGGKRCPILSPKRKKPEPAI